jgi:serine/threonine protein phosphatase PrpC
MSQMEKNKEKSKEIIMVCDGMAIQDALEATSFALVAQILGSSDDNDKRLGVASIVAQSITRHVGRLAFKEKSE